MDQPLFIVGQPPAGIHSARSQSQGPATTKVVSTQFQPEVQTRLLAVVVVDVVVVVTVMVTVVDFDCCICCMGGGCYW